MIQGNIQNNHTNAGHGINYNNMLSYCSISYSMVLLNILLQSIVHDTGAWALLQHCLFYYPLLSLVQLTSRQQGLYSF